MAPYGAMRRPVTPGPDPMARIIGILFSCFLILMVLSPTHGLPVKTERLISENDRYYKVQLQNEEMTCLLCPPGTYVKEHCTIAYSFGICETCPEGTQSEFSSGMPECFTCARCRDDQEEVSSCSSTKNTDCRCKTGTFCPPDQPCEICIPCTTSCPVDKEINAPCNSTDGRCTAPDSSIDIRAIVIPVALSLVLLAVIIIVCVYWKKKTSDTGSKLFGKLTLHVCKGKEDHDDEDQSDLLPKKLQFKEGTDPETKEEIISKSFVNIVRLVPPKEFESLMQRLGMGQNEIDRAKMDNPSNVINQNSAMLQSWHLRKGFDINNLLKALRDINLEMAARDITDQLIREELYIPQTEQNT